MSLRYFVVDEQRNGTCYHEFYKGKWDQKTFWKKDSICLHDDILRAIGGFEESIMAVIPTYNPFGETEIYSEQWTEIGRIIRQKHDEEALNLYLEADEWAKNAFSLHGCFTILGI